MHPLIGLDNQDAWTGAITVAFATLMTGIGAYFAQRASSKSQATSEQMRVPDFSIHEGGTKRDLGPVVAKLEQELRIIQNQTRETAAATKDIQDKVEHMQLAFARHEGQHEGLLRDIGRVVERVFKETSSG
jgi:hypothetical protein